MNESRTIRAVIFDFDGVIVRSNYPGAHVLERLLERHGVKKTAKELFPHFGEHPRHIFREMLHTGHIKRIFGEYKRIMTSEEYISRIRVVRGGGRALSALKKEYRLALASGAVKASLLKVLRHTGTKKYFSAVLSGDDVRLGKPHPEMLAKALKRLKAGKDETVYVCDAPNDVLAARRAGIRSVVVLTGVLDRKTAERMKADYIIRDITRLGSLLGRLNRQSQAACS